MRDTLVSSGLAGLPLLALLAGCATTPDPGTPLERRGDEIVVCGQLFHVGTPVVLWTDPGGYDAYRVEPRFPAEMSAEEIAAWPVKAHYHALRNHVAPDDRARIERDGWTLADVRGAVDLFVLHYDVAGTSRRCFQVLHDKRQLSVHFLLDVDGTIYQTLDVKERAWHATKANDRSIGVEIAQIGAYPADDLGVLEDWYGEDEDGPYVRFPVEPGATGIRTQGFVARPARRDLFTGPVHGVAHFQYDFTDAQYRALAKLAAALHAILPRIGLDAPRGPDGHVLMRALTDDEFASFHGVLGHFHVDAKKVDPGPAFDWERLLDDARSF